MVRSCNYHAQAIRHIHHLLTQNLACLHVAWFSPELTTATLCCMALHLAPFRSCSEYKTMRRESLSQAARQSNANSLLQELHWLLVEQRMCTSLPTSPTRHDRRQCRSIWAATSRHAAASGHCDRHQLHYWKFLSDERLSANVPSALQRHLSGTLCQHLFWTVIPDTI